MQHPALPEEYKRIFEADEIELCRLLCSEMSLNVRYSGESNPKEECEQLILQHAQDSRRTARMSIHLNQDVQGGRKKRRRHSPEDDVQFPTWNHSGTKINQGHGGDLSYQPTKQPLICKQSCKFSCIKAGTTVNDSCKWEVRPAFQLVAQIAKPLPD